MKNDTHCAIVPIQKSTAYAAPFFDYPYFCWLSVEPLFIMFSAFTFAPPFSHNNHIKKG